MNGVELAALINQRAEESRARDDEILRSVHKLETTSAVHSKRIDNIEERCRRHSDRWAEDTGRFHQVELARAQAQVRELTESRKHWGRWVITTIAGLAIAALGAGAMKLFGG